MLAPAIDVTPELLVAGVIESELLRSQSPY
jgi:hypothetical protein